MGKIASNAVLDGLLDIISACTIQTVCSSQPATYYEGADPTAWQASTAYSLGDAARPVTRNGFVYEVTTAGTSGGSEPTWPTTPGNTVGDGSVTWTCRDNYVLANVTMAGGDFTKADGDTNGRKVTMSAKNDNSIHTSGTATHVALLTVASEELQSVTTCTSQVLTSGGTVSIPAWKTEVADPT